MFYFAKPLALECPGATKRAPQKFSLPLQGVTASIPPRARELVKFFTSLPAILPSPISKARFSASLQRAFRKDCSSDHSSLFVEL